MILWTTIATVARGGRIERQLHVFATRKQANDCRDKLLAGHRTKEHQLMDGPPDVNKHDLGANAAGLADAMIAGFQAFERRNIPTQQRAYTTT